MNDNERKLIKNRLLKHYKWEFGLEPDKIKEKLDKKFCNKFTVDPIAQPDYIVKLLQDSISEKNEEDLDLLLSLSEHFGITKCVDEVIAPLLIQPWHHFHDTIARILEFDKNEKTMHYLFLGATYFCENLDYQSDYCQFNSKCLHGLLKIGTEEAIELIKKVAKDDNQIVANTALDLIKRYNL